MIKELDIAINMKQVWIYRTTCVGCKNYVDFRMRFGDELVITKYCTELQSHIKDPKGACTKCSFNRAYPTKWYKIKYKIRKLWQKYF